jgi:F0F1-type ATP synthase membrane subunit b/b'
MIKVTFLQLLILLLLLIFLFKKDLIKIILFFKDKIKSTSK